VGTTHQQVFQRYIHAGAISRDPEAVAALFTADGVYESPLLPPDHPIPRRMTGRDEIRAGVAAMHEHLAPSAGKVNIDLSAVTLHETTDPDTFIAEIDTVLDDPRTTMSLVQIFRLRDGQITHLRDYFTLTER
jgi:uncharacterized protein